MEGVPRFRVLATKKVLKRLQKLPDHIREKFFVLAEQLADQGPFAANWPNYSKLGKDEYHCHLARSWVACWRREKETIIIEVYYVGSRENAPY
jgi:hypothetical protein